MKVSNMKCRGWVQDRLCFNGSNLYGQIVRDKYVVYSYGEHFPLFVYHNGKWYENSDNYSVTTSKHRTQSHPHTDTIKLTTTELKDMIQS